MNMDVSGFDTSIIIFFDLSYRETRHYFMVNFLTLRK